MVTPERGSMPVTARGPAAEPLVVWVTMPVVVFQVDCTGASWRINRPLVVVPGWALPLSELLASGMISFHARLYKLLASGRVPQSRLLPLVTTWTVAMWLV